MFEFLCGLINENNTRCDLVPTSRDRSNQSKISKKIVHVVNIKFTNNLNINVVTFVVSIEQVHLGLGIEYLIKIQPFSGN